MKHNIEGVEYEGMHVRETLGGRAGSTAGTFFFVAAQCLTEDGQTVNIVFEDSEIDKLVLTLIQAKLKKAVKDVCEPK